MPAINGQTNSTDPDKSTSGEAVQGRIQDFLIGGSNLQRGGGGGVNLLIVTDYLIFLPDYSKNSPRKWNNFVSKGCLSEPPEPPLDPPLQSDQDLPCLLTDKHFVVRIVHLCECF